MASDFLNILKELRGTGAPGDAYTDGIYYDITEKATEDDNVTPRLAAGIYASIQVMYDGAAVLVPLATEMQTLSLIADAMASLYADKATLDSLYADKITLDSLYADKLTLDSLYADKATLDSLFADKAKLDSLFTDKATLDSLYADKIKLDSLYADKATLDLIAADIAKGIGTNQPTDSAILNALTNANITIANAAITNADVVITNADVVTTNADATQTALDVIATNADAIATAADVVTVAGIYDLFDDRMLGSFNSGPLTDNDGNPLVEGALYWDTVLQRVMVYSATGWADALTLTETSVNTLTNKTLNSITNDIHANALHYTIKASEVLAKGDALVAVDTLGDGTIIVAKQSALNQPAIGMSAEAYALNEIGQALTVGTFKNYDATGLTIGQILYPNGTGGLTNTPTIAHGNYNQPSAYVAEINGGNAQLVINFHSAHESANLISYDGTTSGLTATNAQAAIDEIIAQKGAINGIASLDGSGLVPAAQLPSYVDDVVEVATYAALPVTGEVSKIYIVVADETQGGDTSTYRWTGSVYALVSNSLTALDVKNLYESNADTNEFSDAEQVTVNKITNIAVTSITFNADGTMTVVTP